MTRFVKASNWTRRGAPKPLAAGKHKKAARLAKAWLAKSKPKATKGNGGPK